MKNTIKGVITPDTQHRFSGGCTSNPLYAGNFHIPKWRSEGILYNLDESDKIMVSDCKLKDNEKIYRYHTYVTDIAKMRPLIKINTESGLVYFLTEESMADDSKIEFLGKGIRAEYLNLFNQ